MSAVRGVALLGATGSIGRSTLSVLRQHPDRFRLVSATAHGRSAELVDICAEFKPELAVCRSADEAAALCGPIRAVSPGTQVDHGAAALAAAASHPAAESVMAAIVGGAGLAPTLAAVRAGKRVLLANKESLVLAGSLFIEAVRAHGAVLLPIDSEHNAIFQCLPPLDGGGRGLVGGVRSILLTGSGGPFRTRARTDLAAVTPDEACAHPIWSMGRKISVDSATMMNKALEIIEAHWLFAAPPERIRVVIHPQSVIHSMVEYDDGSVIAQLGQPDMRTPIAHALAHPDRIDAGVKRLDLAAIGTLGFAEPDFERFPALRLAYEVLAAGGTAGALFNAANEVAVDGFLAGRLRFDAIEPVIEAVLQAIAPEPVTTLEAALEADRRARVEAARLMAERFAS
jgi:1-deoxy-D-xylulose-5-phosphate reductoisomerase